ncbi:Rho GTPase activation protein [Lipomyces arxii]|uniref:Rho GTPase activation protein n=1 Tax=Lipomyces arxii TaxID=56418 RepID=UPI0034CD3115
MTTLKVATQNSSDSVADRPGMQPKRVSVTAIYLSMTSGSDSECEVDDALARAQKQLTDLKAKISVQSKRNFLLERDVRYLDSRIGLLIQNKIASEEQAEVTNRLEQLEVKDGIFPNHRKLDTYGHLFFLLQTEPRYLAALCRILSMSEIDAFLQTVLFTIYGNQYEQREEHLLLTMFQSVLSSQFEAAKEFSSLLRANTPVSRLLTTYTRRGPGQAYLKLVLSDQINCLVQHTDLDLEIDPSKVYEQVYAKALSEANGVQANLSLARSVSAEAAAENELVLQIIRPRVSKLLELANNLFDAIVSSIDAVPYGIRWLCKQIRSLTRRKYPGIDEATVGTLIGAFFFLRYVNPAIVTPHSYMLVDSLPADCPRRTLTLLAKMLQSLANKPLYAKEPYMVSLAEFVDHNKTRINTFLSELCDVPDFYEYLELDHYVALSKKRVSLPITINELYTMHGLVEKYKDVLIFVPNGPLAIILKELGPPHEVLPRSENYLIELPMYSRFETQIEHPNSLLDITKTDFMYMETKALLIQLFRSLDMSGFTRPIDPYKIAEHASASSDPNVVKKGVRAIALLKEIEAQRPAACKCNPLTEEIDEELAQLWSIKDKIVEEQKSLESVYQSIKDHNEYLRGQLDAYKSYLSNVRSQSAPKRSNVNERVGLVAVEDRRVPQRTQFIGPYRYSQQSLQKEGVVVVCNVPENRLPNLYFYVSSPSPGTFIVSLHYKGRSRGLLELNLKLDDLLEMMRNEVEVLDLEYVVVNVPRMLEFLQRQFTRRKW